ncbi:MAG: efflux RND transporter periplasmic adaptor subunit [Gemmatimonadaceae bacterium]|nr:efflux RND transporter periplasmic adaptor subunit [Gemmatimonadaceae bacterium]
MSANRFHRTLALVAITLASASCGKKDAAGGDAGTPAVVGARTAIATRKSVRESVDGIGTIAARPDHIAQMSAPAVTRVTKVFVTVGERVGAGAPLIAFDRAPLDAQNAAAATALAAAQRGVERAKRLVDAGISPRKDLDQAASDLARANADAIAAEHLQSRATLRAPLAGVVTRMQAVLGSTVDPAQTLVEVTDPSALDLLIPVPPASAARVHRGVLVDMTAQPAPDAEALGTATVADIGATIDSAARAVIIRAPITKPARQLRIGETIFARIGLAAHANAVTVPAEALVPDGEGFKIFVLDASRAAHATAVTVGVRDGASVEITSGLSGGETVVTYGAYGVTDSAKVLSPAEGPAATSIPVDAQKP